jgi:hypothetical protein
VSFSWGLLAEIRDLWVPPSLRRRLSLMLAFLGFGLIAGTSGVALIVADTDSDPRSAFAFASLETLNVGAAAPKTSAEVPRVDTVVAREIAEPDGAAREIASRENFKSCPGTSADEVENRCGAGAVSNPGMVAAVSNPPASAVVPTGADSHGPGIAQSLPAASVESTPVTEASAPQSTDVVPAVIEPPASEVAATKPRKTARQQSGQRHAHQPSSAWFDSRPRRGRYAQHPFWPFW